MPVVYDEKSERNLGKIYRGTNTHWISPFSSENVRRNTMSFQDGNMAF